MTKAKTDTKPNWSFNTLRRLAEAMDARLRVIIEPWEDVIGEYEEPAEEVKSDAPPPNWSSFTKAELIRTIKALDKRQTALLNRVAKLQAQLAPAPQADERKPSGEHPAHAAGPFPWQ